MCPFFLVSQKPQRLKRITTWVAILHLTFVFIKYFYVHIQTSILHTNRDVCLTDFMLSRPCICNDNTNCSIFSDNTISVSAHIPLQMFSGVLEHLSFCKWDSICLNPKHPWCVYLYMHIAILHGGTYIISYSSDKQAEWASSHQSKYLKSKESFYHHSFIHLFLSTTYRLSD